MYTISKKTEGRKPKKAWALPYIQQASRNAAGPVLGVRFGPTPHPRPVRFFWWLDYFLCHFLPTFSPDIYHNVT